MSEIWKIVKELESELSGLRREVAALADEGQSSLGTSRCVWVLEFGTRGKNKKWEPSPHIALSREAARRHQRVLKSVRVFNTRIRKYVPERV